MIEVDITKSLLESMTLASEAVLQRWKLGGSDLQRSLEWTEKNGAFVLLANDYFLSVAYGRKRHARKVPVEDLIKWMKKKGISPRNGTYSSVAFLIQRSIYENGIKARDFTGQMTDVSSDIASEDIAYTLSEAIALEIATDVEKLSMT